MSFHQYVSISLSSVREPQEIGIPGGLLPVIFYPQGNIMRIKKKFNSDFEFKIFSWFPSFSQLWKWLLIHLVILAQNYCRREDKEAHELTPDTFHITSDHFRQNKQSPPSPGCKVQTIGFIYILSASQLPLKFSCHSIHALRLTLSF